MEAAEYRERERLVERLLANRIENMALEVEAHLNVAAIRAGLETRVAYTVRGPRPGEMRFVFVRARAAFIRAIT